MIKSFNGFTTFLLGFGLVASNFYTLNLLARKDSGIPNLASLPSTQYSSVQIRSEQEGDKHHWTLATKQHDPKTLTEWKTEERPGFRGKTNTHSHKESLAQFAVFPQGPGGKLTAKQIECIEKAAIGQSNAQMISDTGNSIYVTPALASIPVFGPLLSGLWFGQSRKAAGEIGGEIAKDWNDC